MNLKIKDMETNRRQLQNDEDVYILYNIYPIHPEYDVKIRRKQNNPCVLDAKNKYKRKLKKGRR